ncbi:hypothetical protein KYB31_06530 [Clostridium felsineum]|uniref:hypothetical protein n=1 Tax=Clostridium felsineum TaxID=36839 RepID=UPI00214D15F0|nr:hypothetical protein [Clostridium felsineum]MCR3758650.1 hypothetical protein [Clostridium felsineum]
MNYQTVNNKIYTKYTRTNEENQLNDINYSDKIFFTFNNNLFVNSMFTSKDKNSDYVDLSISKFIDYDKFTKTFLVNSEAITGELYTIKVTSAFGDNVPLNDFYLVADCYVPVGSSIKYFILDEKARVFPIKENISEPLHLASDITSFTIKCVLTKNSMGESPKIYGLSVMFFDAAIEAQYGFINPDLRRFDEVNTGLTVLTRDRAQKDKLVKVTTPTDITNLTYDSLTGNLTKVETTSTEEGFTNTDLLNYGAYVDSNNETTTVLLSILSSSVNNEAVNNEIKYKFFE